MRDGSKTHISAVKTEFKEEIKEECIVKLEPESDPEYSIDHLPLKFKNQYFDNVVKSEIDSDLPLIKNGSKRKREQRKQISAKLTNTVFLHNHSYPNFRDRLQRRQRKRQKVMILCPEVTKMVGIYYMYKISYIKMSRWKLSRSLRKLKPR